MCLRMLAWSVFLVCCCSISACGYLDDDIAMSDEEFEASFASGEGAYSTHLASRGHGTGCRISLGTSHVSVSHPYIGRPTTAGSADDEAPPAAPREDHASHSDDRIDAGWVVIDEKGKPAEGEQEITSWGDYIDESWRL